MEQTKLTLCFYENPGAKKEIEHWENSMSEKIVSKWEVSSEISYVIDRSDNTKELMICTPLDTLPVRDISEIIQMAGNLAILHNVAEPKYYKTLIFGRVKVKQLMCITTMMQLLED